MINTILELYFSRFKCVRRYLGGVWVFRLNGEWYHIPKSHEDNFDLTGLITEDYRK